jgi:anaerobic selenocysteine-containing dehydrogenase
MSLVDPRRLWEKVRSHIGTTVEHPLSPATRDLKARIHNPGVKKTVSVCPYCAVGCSTLVYHRDGRIIDIEGNPDSPVNAGTLCPKDSANFGLHVSPYQRCVFQILKRHFSRYTPEMVEKVTGCPKEAFLEVAKTICENSGRERTMAFCYAVGWTQHSKGVQVIRTAAILQLLLGNIGRPGGGILALRGHATIQGSTDIATLYDILPGYIPMPDVNKKHHAWRDYVENETAETGWWNNLPKYATSQMKAWYGEAFDPEEGQLFDRFPRISGDHSYYPTLLDMKDGEVKGCFVFGQNLAVGGPHAKLARDALRSLDWLVVLDAYEIETTDVWKLDGVDPGECPTEVFFIPSALVAEKDGSLTQTQRMLQWHDKAVEPPDDARSDAWFVYHLGRRIKELYKETEEDRDALIRALTWDYPTGGPYDEPEIESILKEISGYRTDTWEPVGGFAELEADGSTACGCWIYSGVYAGGVNHARDRKPASEQDLVASGWGWAWPDNRRILYNRASADPEGKPWSERKKYVWWDEEQQRWTGSQGLLQAGQPVQPARGPALSVRGHDLPPHRAPHLRGDEPLDPLALRAPARVVLRDQPRAGRREGRQQRRLGDHHDQPRQHPHHRPPLPLGTQRRRERGRGQRHPARRAGSQRRHPRGQGLHRRPRSRSRMSGVGHKMFRVSKDPAAPFEEIRRRATEGR